MFLTAVAIASFAGLLLSSLILSAALLWVGLHWVKARNISMRRTVLATFLATILQPGPAICVSLVSPLNLTQEIALSLFSLFLQVLIHVAVIGFLFRVTVFRALLAWSPTLIGTIVMLAVTFLYDSRLWSRGAPHHHPYALPASNIIGVASNIYWPPSRWRAFR